MENNAFKNKMLTTFNLEKPIMRPINNKMQVTFNLVQPTIEDDYTVFIKEENVLKPMLAFVKEGNELIPIKVLL